MRPGQILLATCAILVCSLFPDEALAGLNRWTTQGPTGGGVGRLVIDPRNPRTLYATGAGGIFKTTDGGVRWERFGGLPMNAGILSLAVDPSVSEVLYAGTTQGGFFQSIDAGRTWRKVFEIVDPFGQQLLVNQFVIDPLNDRIVYAGTSRGVFQSLDRGSSWQVTGLTTGVRCLAIDPEDPRVLWAGGTGGTQGLAAVLFRTEDSGRTWSSYEVDGVVPHSGNSVFAVAVDPNTHNVFTSTRTGILTGGFRLTSSGRLASCIVFDPLNPGVVYACGSADPFFDEGLGVLKSADGGANWSSVGPGNPTRVNSVVVDPAQSGTIYAAVAGPAPAPGEGVFKSLDGGTHWEPAMNGLSSHFVWTVEASQARLGELYAGLGSSFPVHRSRNEGSTWEIASAGITDQNISELAIDPSRPDFVYAAGQLVWKSEDSGSTWLQTSLPLALRYAVAIDPVHPYVVYAATSYFGPFSFSSDGGVYRSVDSGGNWSFSAAGLENTARGRTVFDLVVHPDGIIFAATGAGVFRSGDGGVFWSATALAEVISSLQIDPLNLSTLYAGSYDGGVFKSSDGGTSWTTANTGLPGVSVSCLRVDPVRPRTVYAGTAGAGVFRSTDGGSSWFPWSTGLDVLDVNALAISTNGRILHAATRGGGVFEFEFLPERAFSRVPTRRPPARTLPPRF
jgi:photosystem II stability/assembly factor-like uncharacterized protein